MYRKDPFVIRKTQPRKGLSRSPPKLFGKDIACELGSRYETIDVHIGNQRMILDLAQGGWIHEETEETTVDSRDMVILQKRKRELEKANSILRVKLDILLDMLAEVTAEEELQQISDK